MKTNYLSKVTLVLLYDYNVISKEAKMVKLFAIIRGFLWKYSFIKRDFVICDPK